MKPGCFHARRWPSHPQSCKKGKKLKKKKEIPFPAIISPRNPLKAGCEESREGLQEDGRATTDNSKTRNSSSMEQLGIKHDSGHGAAAGWELPSLFFHGKFGIYCIEDKSIVVLGHRPRLPPATPMLLAGWAADLRAE